MFERLHTELIQLRTEHNGLAEFKRRMTEAPNPATAGQSTLSVPPPAPPFYQHAPSDPQDEGNPFADMDVAGLAQEEGQEQGGLPHRPNDGEFRQDY